MSAVDYVHGVNYTPSTVHTPIEYTVEDLQKLRIKYIRLQWVDLINNVRCRVLPMSYFVKLLQSPRPGVGVVKISLGLVYLMCAPAFSPVGEYLYVPDMASVKLCPYAPDEASVMGWFQEKAPVPRADLQLTVQVDLCPRTILKRVVDKAKDADVEFLLGFESEFILLKSTKPVEAVNYHSWSAVNGFPSGTTEALVLREIADSILASGISLQMYHAEAAPGQYEMVTAPLPPLESVDALIHTREIITHTAAKHGLRATFAPRVYMDSAGSSTHTHISVHSKRNEKTGDRLSSYERYFLSSVLNHLPALIALTYPTRASFKRMADGVWAGGTYVCYGIEHRDVPMRITNFASPSSRNFEMRVVDGTANPYLAMAGVLGAGFAGIRDKIELTMQDCGQKSAADMPECERKALGIAQRMPLTWEDSRQNFQESKFLKKEVFSEEFVEKYLSVNKTLDEALALDGDDEKAALTRLVEFY